MFFSRCLMRRMVRTNWDGKRQKKSGKIELKNLNIMLFFGGWQLPSASLIKWINRVENPPRKNFHKNDYYNRYTSSQNVIYIFFCRKKNKRKMNKVKLTLLFLSFQLTHIFCITLGKSLENWKEIRRSSWFIFFSCLFPWDELNITLARKIKLSLKTNENRDEKKI